MSLEINNVYGVICLKGKVSNSHLQEVKSYFKALLTIENSVIINLCQVKSDVKKLTRVLDTIISELEEGQSLKYYSFPEPALRELYAQLNDATNFYQAA